MAPDEQCAFPFGEESPALSPRVAASLRRDSTHPFPSRTPAAPATRRLPPVDQIDFLLAEGDASILALPDPLGDLVADISRLWGLPIGEAVCVTLRNHSMPHLSGRLKLSHAPALPLDPRESLQLRLGDFEFTSRQISSWALL